MKRAVVVVALLLLLLALTLERWPRPAPVPSAEPQNAVPLATPARTDPLALLPEARKTECFARIEKTADGFAPRIVLPSRDPKSRWHNPAKPVETRFPERFADAVHLSCNTAQVTATPEGANPDARGELAADGSLVYRDAFANCDVVYRCGTYKTEEYLVIRDEPAAQTASAPQAPQLKTENSKLKTFRWSFSVPGRPLTPRLTPAHTIEFCDEAGVPRIRINAPEGHDAAGKRLRPGLELTLALDGARLTLTADLSACAYPVVIDPTWSSTGTMAASRSGHAIAKLPSGKILVVGGIDGDSWNGLTEIYDAQTGVWAAPTTLSVGRSGLSLTVLPDGRILSIGGVDQTSNYLTSCAAYSEGGGGWQNAGNLLLGRTAHCAELLPDGSVLVIGGVAGGSPITNCEIFNPTLGTSSNTMPLNGVPGNVRSVRLDIGDILVLKDDNPIQQTVCQQYNPSTNNWTDVAPLTAQREANTIGLIALPGGRAVAFGGFPNFFAPPPIASSISEIFESQSGAWTPSSPLATGRYAHAAMATTSGLILAVCGSTGSYVPIRDAEAFFPGTGQWRSTGPSLFDMRAVAAIELPNKGILVSGGFTASCEILSLYDPPSIVVTPSVLEVGQTISFVGQASSFTGEQFAVSWNFGDGTGSDQAESVHTFTAEGSYTVTLTVTYAGGATTMSSTVINLVQGRPTARFTTSDVVSFVGLPFTFDATTSTDPENAIVSYAWSFGDGSPNGAGQVLSKVYTTAGTYTATLTVTDAEGLTASVARLIEVLPADQLGLFNAGVTYKTRWDRNKVEKDTLSLTAELNVGDEIVAQGVAVAFEVAGQRFTGTLDQRLRDYTDRDAKWQIKANLRNQGPGEVRLKLTIKKASLGLGFNQAGAIAGADLNDLVEATIPLFFQLGAHTYDLPIPSEFKFSSGGTRAKGTGDGP